MFNSTNSKKFKGGGRGRIYFRACVFAGRPRGRAGEGESRRLGVKEITGEVVDMMCYVDHNAVGDRHAGCAAKCIKGGGPVGIVSDGKAYLIVGDH